MIGMVKPLSLVKIFMNRDDGDQSKIGRGTVGFPPRSEIEKTDTTNISYGQLVPKGIIPCATRTTAQHHPRQASDNNGQANTGS